MLITAVLQKVRRC